MLDYTAEIMQLREYGPSPELIKAIIGKFLPRRAQMYRLYERYRATMEGVPILTRRLADLQEVNNKVNDDFFSEIIDIKTGYFAGKPITYSYAKDADGYEPAQENITRFTMRNHIADLDAETTKYAAICGYGARLVYLDPDAQERVINIDPFNAIILSETSISEPEYGLRLYTVQRNRNEYLKVEFYDDENIYYYAETRRNLFELDPDAAAPVEPHQMEHCPLIGFPNNDELMGDAEKVLQLIDAYDRTISDVNSEVEAFRLAYMAFEGGIIDQATLDEARRTGAFTVPEGGKIYWITKQMDDSLIENHLNRLHSNIYRFSKTPDLSDEAFSGNASGVALKFKLFGLESKCVTFERKMQAGLTHMFQCVSDIWQKKRIIVDPYELVFEFKRNFPLDLKDEAETTGLLKGLVSEQTRLSLLSFVDDADYEQELIEQEAEDIPRLELGGEYYEPGRTPGGNTEGSGIPASTNREGN